MKRISTLALLGAMAVSLGLALLPAFAGPASSIRVSPVPGLVAEAQSKSQAKNQAKTQAPKLNCSERCMNRCRGSGTMPCFGHCTQRCKS